jgi:hypothetical protein
MKAAQLVRRTRQIFTTILRSKEIEKSDSEITEFELIEAMLITEQVVISRLSGDPREWKGDEKRHFSFLFKSIRTEAQEAIRDYFTTEGVPARGVSINKFNTIVLDAIFEILQAVGPKRAPKLVTKLRESFERDLRNLPETHTDDAIVAQAMLKKYSKERADKLRKPKKMTKAERLAAIEVAVHQLQLA